MEAVATVILAGGQGIRLFPLTKDRAKPSVPMAGKYRLIDIAMSNCLHSGMNQIFILTQFNSASLNRHISEAYQMGSISRLSVQVLAAEQTPQNRDWYQGTADAVRHNLMHIFSQPNAPRDVLILAGDHFYRMDYSAFVGRHRESGADVTVGVLPVERKQASRFGILKANEQGWIEEFAEKPSSEEELNRLKVDGLEQEDGVPRDYLASMGIYVIKADVLRHLLETTDHVDFGHHVIPGAIGTHRFLAYPFSGYWEDIGTMRAFYEANLALLDTIPKFNFYDELRPIFTRQRHLPPTKVNESKVHGSMLASGSIVDRSTIRRSIIGTRGIVRDGTTVDSSLLMGADYYESLESIAENAALGRPPIGIGTGCQIRGAIIDKNARVGDGVILTNRAGHEEYDSEDGNWFVRDGIIVVPKNAVIGSGTVV
jgi:glucose-1-phosphate adenylyltransferase